MQLPYNPTIPLLDIYSAEMKMCLYKNLKVNVDSSFIHSSQNMEQLRCSQMSFIAAKTWKQLKTYFTTDGWMVKQTVLHVHNDCYSLIKERSLLMHTETWMNLQRITLSEKNQSQKLHMVWFYSLDIPEVTKFWR